jgi:hypothetical protein
MGCRGTEEVDRDSEQIGGQEKADAEEVGKKSSKRSLFERCESK